MSNVVALRFFVQRALISLPLVVLTALPLWAADDKPVEVPNGQAKSEKEMKAYTDVITGTKTTFDLVPIPGGEFLMGSPAKERTARKTKARK